VKAILLRAGLALTTAVGAVVSVAPAVQAATPVTASLAPGTGSAAASDANMLLRKGIDCGERGDFAGAQRAFRSVVALDQKNKLAWYNLGIIAGTGVRTAEAVADYDRAIRADPSYTPALYNEAVLIETAHPMKAIALYRRIVATNPRASTAYLHLGRTLARQKDNAAARDAFAHAIAVDPTLLDYVPQKFRAAAAKMATTLRPGVR
jgi:tetratricopeptide (TPR) repeat protein